MPTYSSIADLIFNNNRQPFTTALVLGAVSVGDGGGGIFVWHPMSTAAANGETVIDVPNLAVGRWLLIISNSASPTKDKGDLIVNNGTGLGRFPLSGVDGRVLTEDSEQPLGVRWGDGGGGGYTSATIAAGGTDQGTATPITTDIVYVTDIGGIAGVRLPPATGNVIFLIIPGNGLRIYPASGEQIIGSEVDSYFSPNLLSNVAAVTFVGRAGLWGSSAPKD